MSLDSGIGQNGWYEQIAAVFVKYECFSYPGPPNKKIMGEINKAYEEIAKTLGLTDIQAVKTEISNMKDYVNKMMRSCVRLSIVNGGGGQDALNYAPPWVKLLDPPLKVLKLACNMETLQTLKNYNTGNRVFQVTSEIVRCACRAAARELARDCTNEGASKPSKDSIKGGSCGLAGNRTNGEASKLAKDSTNGGVSAIGSHHTNGGVSDSAIDSTERAARAASALVSEDAVREYAESVDIHVNILHSIWTRIYAQSICKLKSLIAAGDKASEKYAPIVWLAADAALLYDTCLMVVVDKTFQSSVTLSPLILLFELMVAAHKKMKEIKTLPNLMAKNIIGAQTGTLENSNINIPSSSDKSIPDKDTSERNSVGEMRVDGNKSNELETERSKDVYERERSRHIWALVHINYILSGRSSSAVLLQRRWHEMKQMARQLLTGKDAPLSPSPILLALAKRFPSILTEKLPPWSELVLDNLICQDSQLEPYRRLYAGIRLEVPNEIGENLIFDDLYDWSDDEVEVIDEKRETVLVPDSDDEETDKVTNEQTDTSVNNTTIDNNTSELNDEYDSIKKLESIDPTKAKVQIIFENDSDDDLNDFIHGVNDPGASKNTNSNITYVIEGLIRNSVSNEIETQVRPDNHNQNVGIDMDKVICDLRNNLIRVSSNVSNKDTQTIYTDTEGDSDAADEMCDDIDEPSPNDEGERPDPLLVDKKLVQLSHVVLTPIEDLPEWRKHSRNNMIKCREFSVKNFTKKVHVTSKQLENCRPYISKKSSNGIWFRKNQELRQIPKDIRKKINILSKRLNLPRTYFSQEFWSERNLELVELCRPFSIQLKRIPRVIKRIELADIDDVRRINSTILTAQVAPITVEANRMFVIDPSEPSTTAERVQQSSGQEDQIDQKISTGSKETYSIDGLRAYEDVKDVLDSDDDVPTLSVSSMSVKEELQDNWDNGIHAVSDQIGAFNPLKLPTKEKANEVVKVSKEDVPEKPNLILENEPKESNEIILKTSALNKSNKDSNNLNKIPKNSKKVKKYEPRKKIQKDSFLINSNNNLTEPHVTNNPKIHNRNETLTLNETKSANNINLALPKTSKIQINDKPNDKKHDSNFLVPNNKYICNICNYEAVSKKYLIIHLRLHDTKAKIHCCSQCKYMTNAKSSFNNHLKKHTGEKPYECNICRKKFSQIASLNSHRRTHTGEKPYECLVCERKFSDISNLNTHRRTHTGEKPYECHVCERKFSHSAHLNRHRRTHTSEKPYECLVCERKFSDISNLNSHRRTHTREKPYECHICQRKFSQISNLNTHKRTHTGEKPYECHICQRKFSQISNLNTHKTTHTGEKPYECHVCERKYNRSADLRNHIITHTGEKPHECHVCQRKFGRISSLNRHRRTHTGEKPYECHVCERKFSHIASLNSHRRTHTGEKPYECHICQRKFSQNSSLNSHRRTHR